MSVRRPSGCRWFRTLFRTLALYLALATPELLSACSGDRREVDTKRCVAQAQQNAGQAAPSQSESAEERRDRIGDQVASCMEELGYRHDASAMANERCVDDVDYNPYCYRRRR